MKFPYWILLSAFGFLACSNEPAKSTESGGGSSPRTLLEAVPKPTPRPPAPGQAPMAPTFNGKDPLFSEVEVAFTYGPMRSVVIGETLSIAFVMQLTKEDWHLYSARKDGNIAYNPTELEIFPEESKGFELIGQIMEDRSSNERFDKTLKGIVRDIDSPKVTYSQFMKVTGPEVVLSGQFTGQYCQSEGACKFFKYPIEWKFSAVK